MGTLETRLEQLGIFAVLLIAYGTTVGGVNVANTFNQIFAPWPNINNAVTPLKSCSWLNAQCNADNIADATISIAASIEYPAILFFNVVARISAFGTVLLTLFFGPEVGVQSVPFLDLFFIVVFIVAPLIEVFRLFRGNSSGSTL